MATTATPTLVKGPGVIDGLGHLSTFTLLWDTTDASGDVTLDLSAYFSGSIQVIITGGYVGGYVLKAHTYSAATCKIACYGAGTAGSALDSIDSTDLSTALAAVQCTVIGKALT